MHPERPPHRHRDAVDTLHAIRWIVPAVLACVFIGLGVLALVGRAGDVRLSQAIDATVEQQVVAQAVALPRRPHRPVLVLDAPDAAASPLADLLGRTELIVDVRVDARDSDYVYGREAAARYLVCAPETDGALLCPFDFFTTDARSTYDITLRLEGDDDARTALAALSPRLRIEPDPVATFVARVLAGGAWVIALVLGIRAGTMAREGLRRSTNTGR